MKLSELGEEGFLSKIVAPFIAKRGRLSSLGFPDDARDFFPKAPRVVMSVDGCSLRSLLLPWRDLEDAAWSLVSGAVSDQVAKGATPSYSMVVLGLSPDAEEEGAAKLVRGLAEAFRHYGVEWVGGDTNSSSDPWAAVALVGFTPAKRLPSRSGARPGDAIVVTGRYGAMGFVAEFGVEAASREEWVVRATKRPRADLSLATVVSAHYRSIHASMDTSDGLGYTLETVARLSGVGIKLERAPRLEDGVLAVCGNDKRCAMRLALNGGEEYGAVLAVDPSGLGAVLEELEAYGVDHEVVGMAVEGGGLHVEGVGPVEIRRWDQFKGFTAWRVG